MDKAKYEKVIEILTDRISSLETDIFIKDMDIRNLKEENARLNELLTPTKKGDFENE